VLRSPPSRMLTTKRVLCQQVNQEIWDESKVAEGIRGESKKLKRACEHDRYDVDGHHRDPISSMEASYQPTAEKTTDTGWNINGYV